MSQKIFVNLPVADLDQSIAYFTALGYRFNPQFTDDTATCMIVSDAIFVMLLTHEKFAGFTPRPVADAHTSTQVLIALDFPDRAAVDAIATKAVANGGREARPAEDLGFMYQRSIADLDGHIWEYFHMDMAALPAAD